MVPNTTNAGQSVRSLQTFLRYIHHYDNRIPAVIPDGIYGEQTKNAVTKFQEAHNSAATGEVDKETWDKIVDEYERLSLINGAPNNVSIYPINYKEILPNTKSIHLYAIQAMLYSLTIIFPKFGEMTISDTYRPNSVNVVKHIQTLCDLEPTGKIDRATWNYISLLYEIFVSENRITPIK